MNDELVTFENWDMTRKKWENIVAMVAGKPKPHAVDYDSGFCKQFYDYNERRNGCKKCPLFEKKICCSANNYEGGAAEFAIWQFLYRKAFI